MRIKLLLVVCISACVPTKPNPTPSKASLLIVCSEKSGVWRWTTGERTITDAEAAVVIDTFAIKVPKDARCARVLCQRIANHLVCAGHEP